VAGLGLAVDAAANTIHDFFADGQTDAAAFVSRVEALKHGEYLVATFGRQTDAIVMDSDAHVAV